MGGGSREGGLTLISSVGEGRSKLIFATERGYNIILSRMLPISQHPPPPPGNYCTVPNCHKL